MFIAGVYFRKINDKNTRGFGHVEIYKSMEEYNELCNDPILLDLDPGCYIARHPRMVFPVGTNIVSVSKNDNTIHLYRGYEIVWIPELNKGFQNVDFDSLSKD